MVEQKLKKKKQDFFWLLDQFIISLSRAKKYDLKTGHKGLLTSLQTTVNYVRKFTRLTFLFKKKKKTPILSTRVRQLLQIQRNIIKVTNTVRGSSKGGEKPKRMNLSQND